MKLNDRSVASFAVCSSPIDKEGYLSKRGSLNQSYQRRWFVLKGNLLFYFEKKRDKEPVGVIVLEHCSVQASEHEKHALEISFDGSGTRTYILLADNDTDMSAWIRAISHASYEYLKSIVEELQERLDALMSRKATSSERGSVDQVGAGVKHLRVSPRKDEVASSQTVVNGHLMDIEEVEEEPKVPPKTRHTVYYKSSEEDLPQASERRSRTSTDMDSILSINLQRPHASPVEKPYPYHQGAATLSPRSSVDPTACLLPEVCTLPMKSEPSLIDFDAPPLLPQKRAFTPPASTDYQQKSVGKKSIVELHEEFTDVMKSLKN